MKPATITAYNAAQNDTDRPICAALRAAIERDLPQAEGRIWHAHPVWFLDGNPIVGYSRLRECVRLMFWSGQSFDTPGLTAEGSFKAAVVRYTSAAQIDPDLLRIWMDRARIIQWDYKNIVRRKGRLERLDPAPPRRADLPAGSLDDG